MTSSETTWVNNFRAWLAANPLPIPPPPTVVKNARSQLSGCPCWFLGRHHAELG